MASIVAGGLVEHWVFQDVYTIQKVALNSLYPVIFIVQVRVVKKIEDLYNDFFLLKNRHPSQQTPQWQANKLTPFLARLKTCLDISCKNVEALKKLEKFYGVKMTEQEHKFLEDQLGPRLMLCTTEVDRYSSKSYQ